MDKKLAQPKISSIFKISQKKTAVLFALILLITMAISALHTTPTQATPLAVLYVNPQKTQLSTSNYPLGSTFTVQITIANVTNMYGYQYQFNWNSSILSLASVHDIVPLPPGYFLADNTTSTSGQTTFTVTSTSGSGVTGSFLIRTITFRTMIAPNPPAVNYVHTFMNFSNDVIGDSSANSIFHQTINGEFYYVSPPVSYLMSQVTPPDIEWTRSFGYAGASGNGVTCAVQSPWDGGYALAGYTILGGQSYCWVVRTDEQGNRLWNLTYGSVGAWLSIVQNDDGGYTLAGYLNNQAYAVRINSWGSILWTYQDPGTGTAFYSVVRTSDGGWAAAGVCQIFHFPTTSKDFYLCKFKSDGSGPSKHNYGGTNDEVAYGLIQTSDGGYAMAGYQYSDNGYGVTKTYGWIVKTDSSFNQQWERRHGGQEPDMFSTIVEATPGQYLLGGFTMSYGNSLNWNPWLLMCQQPGTGSFSGRLWDVAYNGSDPSFQGWTNSIAKTGGNYIVAFDKSMALVDPQGKVLWVREFNGVYGGLKHSVAIPTRDGACMLATGNNTSSNICLIKLDLETLQMSPPIYGPTNPIPYVMHPQFSAPRQYEAVKVQTMINGTRTGRNSDCAFLYYEVDLKPWAMVEMSYNTTSHYWYGFMPGQDAYQNVTFCVGAVLGQSIITSQLITYSVSHLVPGDVNGDFHVDVLDLIICATHLGQHW